MVDLPEKVITWTGRTLSGEVTRLEQAVARREAWLVEVTQPSGEVIEGFLRIERERPPGRMSSLEREVVIVRALGTTDLPVPGLYGHDPDLRVALFARLHGRADLHNMPLAQQRAVMRDFIDVVARLHLIDIDTLDLPGLARPATPAECALNELDDLVERHADYLARRYDPLLRYGLAWLRRFAPDRVPRVSLVQGDTGPVNFMFQEDRVSAIFDWEWGHLGDPIEDLGNIATREFWNPSGGMAGLVDRYRAATGFAVDHDRVRYYCVQQQIRGMMGIHAATESVNPHEPIAWYLAYRYIGDRATCEALAEATHVPLPTLDLPPEEGAADPLAEAALYALRADIAPAVDSEVAKARLRDVGILVQCIARVARHGAWVDEAERADAAALLGADLPTLDAATTALGDAIDAGTIDDAAMIAFLYRRAARREWLYAPSAELYPDRHWSPL
ncbi:phosphotransferase family protein [Sphingomonas jatrophae]|uniref:Predicted kinase, aminoglycoside phosphotransferase (APT) family n=1 Tax=Sphingomonas jatrophae TaxID=1166337 RepID=A0A1I6KEZ1_9SPHN|nr:phosphotransferase family protein [Sphingomonas jatrophae]SFR89787.1 Predicted kinase, aminoglycoside phosphotransferase (APT) family [Sphingomonas jatrophae]